MANQKAPHKPGDIFDVPLAKLAPRAHVATDEPAELHTANYRTGTPPESLEELAKSIADVGQLQPVLVFWDGSAWAIAAGFRRVLAMELEADRYGFRKVECKAVPREKATLIRAVENLAREDPSSHDTAQYLYMLNQGEIDGVKYSAREIAESLGRSERHVANLIRFFRQLPDFVRQAWRNDKSGKFTFAKLNELATAARNGAILPASEVARILGLPFAGFGPAGGETPGTSEGPSKGEGEDEASSGEEDKTGGDEDSNGLEPSGATSSLGRGRRLGRRGARKLVDHLRAGIPKARFKDDDRAVVLADALEVMAGEADPAVLKAHIERVRRDLGAEG